MLFATLAAGVCIFLPVELTSLAKNAIASALFNANLMLLSETGYFDIDASLKPLLHLWSLGIEEQFYLAWPLALWLTPHRWRRAMIAIVLAGSFALNVAFVKTHPAGDILSSIHPRVGATCGCNARWVSPSETRS